MFTIVQKGKHNIWEKYLMNSKWMYVGNNNKPTDSCPWCVNKKCLRPTATCGLKTREGSQDILGTYPYT